MNGDDHSEAVLEEQCAQVLARLVVLHAQIKALRDPQTRLEDEMDLAEEEYLAALADLQRQRRALRREIARLELSRQHPLQQPGPKPGDDEPDKDEKDSGQAPDTKEGGEGMGEVLITPERKSRQQTEAIIKDELCEFVAYVIPDRNDPLLTTLGDMYRNPRIRLADMLEIVPVALWEKESRRERGNLRRRLDRLLIWEEALSSQLASLQRLSERLKNDRRHDWVKKRRKGVEAWRAFIEGRKDELRQRIASDEEELERWRSETPQDAP